MTAKKIDRELAKKYSPRFGQIAVEKEYVSAKQVQEAIMEQIKDDFSNRPHRPIGRIMLDNGLMTAQQIEEVLTELFKVGRGE